MSIRVQEEKDFPFGFMARDIHLFGSSWPRADHFRSGFFGNLDCVIVAAAIRYDYLVRTSICVQCAERPGQILAFVESRDDHGDHVIFVA